MRQLTANKNPMSEVTFTIHFETFFLQILDIEYLKYPGAWLGTSVDGHRAFPSKQKPGQGPRPLSGYLCHVVMASLNL